MRISKTIVGVMLLGMLARPGILLGQRAASRPTAAAGLVQRIKDAAAGAASASQSIANNAQSADQQWKQVLTFMDQYSPIRAAVLRKANLPPTAPMRVNMTKMWQNYNNLGWQLGGYRLQTIRAQDNIYGIQLQFRSRQITRDAARQQLRAEVLKLHEVALEETQVRINNLQAQLNQQKAIAAKELDGTTIDAETDQDLLRATPPNRAGRGLGRGMQPPVPPRQAAPATRSVDRTAMPADPSDLDAMVDPNLSLDQWLAQLDQAMPADLGAADPGAADPSTPQ